MKLRLVPARQGAVWVKMGIQAYFKHPFSLTLLTALSFALAMGLGVLSSVLSPIALILAPASSLGLMVAAREIFRGQFPKPSLLLAAFQGGRQRLRAILLIGLFYAMVLLLVIGLLQLLIPPEYANIKLTDEKTLPPGVLYMALFGLLVLGFYMAVSIVFCWYAPALAYWHDTPPLKSLFFSMVACLRNIRAFIVLGIGWVLFFMAAILVLGPLAVALSGPELAGLLLTPLALIGTSMLVASLYFSFEDCFEAPSGDTDDTAHP